MSRYLFFLLLGVTTSVFAQKIYLPVQSRQQWTFLEVTEDGTRIDSRLYDQLGDINLPWLGRPDTESGYYQVEKGGELGLVAGDFELVLPPAWREIHPISDQYFLVSGSDGYQIIDRRSKVILQADTYQAVKLPDPEGLSFFILQQDGRWGVQKRGQSKWIIKPEYALVEFMKVGREGLFKVQGDSITSGGWQLLDWSGAAPSGFQGTFEVIEKAGGNHLIVQEKNRKTDWSIRDLSGKELLVLPPETSIMPLNDHLLAYREKGNSAYAVLAMRTNITPLVESFDHLQVLGEELVFYQTGGQSGFIPAHGRLQPLPADLKVSKVAGTADLLRMKGVANDKWGLYAPGEQGLLLDFQYDSIAPFRGALARVMRAGKVGLINREGTTIAAPEYDRILGLDPGTDHVYAYWKDSVRVFAVDPEGKVRDRSASRLAIDGLGPEKHYWPQYQMSTRTVDRAMPTASRFPDMKEAGRSLQNIAPVAEGDTLWMAKGQSYWQPQAEGYQLMQWEEVEVVVRERSTTKSKKKKRKPAAPAPKKTELVMKWVPGKINYSSLKQASSVNWILAYQDEGGLVSNELTHNGRAQFSARKISLLRPGASSFLTDVEMIGIRLSDFADGLPYAAFCDLDGKFGLIDKAGKQLLDDTGKPLRFTYVSKPSEGMMQVCHPVAAFSQVGLSLTDLYREFHMEAVNSIGNYISTLTSDKQALWGYIDLRGDLLFPFEFDLSVPFEQGHAVNRKQGKWGVLSADKGNLIPFEFDRVSRENDTWRVVRTVDEPGLLYFDNRGREYGDEELARLAIQGQRLFRIQVGRDPVQYGFVDRDGIVQIAPQFDYASEFQEGLATVRKDRRWFFIDEKGATIIQLDTSILGIIEVGQFRDGLCPIRKTTVLDRKPTRKYGYLNTKGQIAIAPVFDGAAPFQGGVAVVDSLNLDNYRPGQEGGIPRDLALIDQSGQLLTGYDFRRIGAFNAAGFAEVVQAGTGKQGVLDRKGQLLTGSYYERVKTFPAGMVAYDGTSWLVFDYSGAKIDMPAAKISEVSYFENNDLLVKNADDRWMHLRITDGKAAIAAQGFRSIRPFDSGYALASRDGETLLYGRDGTIVRPRSGQVFRSWSNQLLGVKENGREYYANLGLQSAFDRIFDGTNEFQDNCAIVTYQGKMGVIDRNGLFVVPPKFTAISREKEGYLQAAAPNSLYGYYTASGEELVPARYDHIELLPNGIIRVEFLDQVGYYRPDGTAIWDPAAE